MASLGTWPASLVPESCRLTPRINQRANSSPGGGSEQVVDMLNDRWVMELTLPIRYYDDAATVEAFLNSFRGMNNTISAWHFARPEPKGTLDGSPTLSADAAQGASSIVIATTAGKTVKAGDMLGVGGLLLQVQTDATADGSGVLTVPIINRLRSALSSGAAVTWDKPTATFRKLSDTGVLYREGLADEIQVVLGEAIS